MGFRKTKPADNGGKGKGLSTPALLGVAIALVAAIAMTGGVDGTSPPPDLGKFVQKFKDIGSRTPAQTRKPASELPANEPPPMTCEGDQCWWTDIGKPGQEDQ